MLLNIRNTTPLQTDWESLQLRSTHALTLNQNNHFSQQKHLFATNAASSAHNIKMLTQLHSPIACATTIIAHQRDKQAHQEEQLAFEILLSIDQEIMLIANLWIEVGLVNGALGQIKQIVYDAASKPLDLPKYVVILFKHYTGPSWDPQNAKHVPIPPITRGNHTQIPLAMAWSITIQKSQGLTLDFATVDIGKTEKQGLTFTTLSRAKAIEHLCIQLAFTYQRYSRLKGATSTILRKTEEVRLLELSCRTEETYLQNKHSQVCKSHLHYVFMYCISSIQCINPEQYFHFSGSTTQLTSMKVKSPFTCPDSSTKGTHLTLTSSSTILLLSTIFSPPISQNCFLIHCYLSQIPNATQQRKL